MRVDQTPFISYLRVGDSLDQSDWMGKVKRAFPQSCPGTWSRLPLVTALPRVRTGNASVPDEYRRCVTG